MVGDDPKSSALENDDDEDPFYDPYYEPFSEENLLNLILSPNPNLMDLCFAQDPLPPPPPTPPLLLPPPPPPPASTSMEINETGLLQELSLSISNCDTNDEFLGSSFDDDLNFSWDMFDIPGEDLNDNIDSNIIGEIGNENGSNVVGETSRLEASTRVFEENGVNFEIGGASTTPVQATITPTLTEGILLCTCCNLLRRLVHTDGKVMMGLDIHGGIGFFCHAILETPLFPGSTERRHQTYNLMDFSMEDVKKFIEDYCEAKRAGGFDVAQDTNADFYRTINACSAHNWSLISTLPSREDVPVSLAMPAKGLNVPRVPLYVGLREEPPVPKQRPRRQTPLAAQRERTGKLTVKDMSMHFHLPIQEAARRLSLCPTVVKKICRKGGLFRWPYRKLSSLQKKVATLKNLLCTATNEQVRAHAEQEIERLENKINDIFDGALKNFN